MKILTFILSMFATTTVFASFDDSQKTVLNKAYQYGNNQTQVISKMKTRKDLGYLMAAIAWQESSAGKNIRSNNSVGVYQNYIKTVSSRYKQKGINKSHSAIVSELKNHDRSAHWSIVELSYWLDVHNGDVKKALASYNAGWNTSKGMPYANRVLTKANKLKVMKIF